MLVDCQTCPVRGVHCADCMVTALSALTIGTHPVPTPIGLDPEPGAVPLDRAERRAVSAFLGAGLISTATANAARARVHGAPLAGPSRRAV